MLAFVFDMLRSLQNQPAPSPADARKLSSTGFIPVIIEKWYNMPDDIGRVDLTGESRENKNEFEFHSPSNS